MRLELTRLEIDKDATIGQLKINGEWFCWVLEDLVRAAKIKHQTAIPAGEYRVRLSKSQRFGEVMPEILNVPEYTGIRIHPGNDAADTSGCPLVGMNRNGSKITDSRKAFDGLMRRMTSIPSGEAITIKITQPQEWPKWGERVTVEMPAPPEDFPSESAIIKRATAELDQLTRYTLADLHPVPALVEAVPATSPASQPYDTPITATVDGDRAWRIHLVAWFLGLGTGGYGWMRDDYRLLYICAFAALFITALWFIRSITLDRDRIKVAADPNKYNVH